MLRSGKCITIPLWRATITRYRVSFKSFKYWITYLVDLSNFIEERRLALDRLVLYSVGLLGQVVGVFRGAATHTVLEALQPEEEC